MIVICNKTVIIEKQDQAVKYTYSIIDYPKIEFIPKYRIKY